MDYNTQNTTPLLTIYDSFVRPYVRESQLRTPLSTNIDQVKKNNFIRYYKDFTGLIN
jgi:hypothetical protein